VQGSEAQLALERQPDIDLALLSRDRAAHLSEKAAGRIRIGRRKLRAFSALWASVRKLEVEPLVNLGTLN
jgi:hypothetical protein